MRIIAKKYPPTNERSEHLAAEGAFVFLCSQTCWDGHCLEVQADDMHFNALTALVFAKLGHISVQNLASFPEALMMDIWRNKKDAL